jgi:hypothetical protein
MGLSKTDINRLNKTGAFIDSLLSKINRSAATFRRLLIDEVEGSNHDPPEDEPYPKDRQLILLISISLFVIRDFEARVNSLRHGSLTDPTMHNLRINSSQGRRA